MITRPLDVSTRLHPPPRSLDYLYWVNAVLIGLFFVFFGSRFVLSPGMGIKPADKVLPAVANAVSGAVPTEVRLEVAEGGRLWGDTGLIAKSDLPAWLAQQGKTHPGGTLLLHFDVSNPAQLLTDISSEAYRAGLGVQIAGMERSENADSGEHAAH